jgi:Ca-activated chloride channel family protein
MTSKHKTLHRTSAILLGFLLLTIGVSETAGQGQTLDSPQSRDAKILLTAIDKDGRFVTALRAEDLRLLVNGLPQKIEGFEKTTDRTLSIAILIDTSASQERTLPAQKSAANSFLDSVMRPGVDRVAIATFTGTLAVEQKLTNDVTLLRQAIARAQFVPPPGYSRGVLVVGRPPPMKRTPATLAAQTALWDAVIETCKDLLSQSARGTRRAIVVLTDGQDTISQNKMAAAVDRAVSDSVAVYAIGIGDKDPYGVDKDALRKLSERTGGRAFFPKKPGDLNDIFAEIGQELRSQYVISYSPVNRSDGPGKIRVEMLNPELSKSGVQLFYQQVIPK